MKKFFRKIHLWLSVPFGLFIAVVCLSGALLAFESEISEMCHREVYFVEPAGRQPLPLSRLMETVRRSLPDSVDVSGVTVSADSERAYRFSLTRPRRAVLCVNQYTGEVTGRVERAPFFHTLMRLHRWLLGSPQREGISAGKLLVGLSTLALVLILVSGIVIWWPSTREAFRHRMRIPLREGAFHFWKGLHVAGGVYVTLFLLLMALSGLTWSFSWYRSGVYALFGADAARYAHGASGGEHRDRGRGGDGRGHGHPQARQDSVAPPEAEARRGGSSGNAEEKARPARGGRDHAGKAVGGGESSAGTSRRGQAEMTGADSLSAPGEADGDERPRHRHGRRGRGEGGWHRRGEASGYRREDAAPDSAGGTGSSVSGTAENADAATGATAYAGPERSGGLDDSTAASHRENRRDTRPAEARRGPQGRGRHRPSRSDSGQVARAASRPALRRQDDDRPERPTVRPVDFSQWQAVMERLVTDRPDYRQIILSDGKAMLSASAYGLADRAADTYEFEPATGRITATRRYADTRVRDNLHGWIYAVHTGKWGGWPMRVLYFLSALVGFSLPLTGYYLWWKRLRRKRRGKAPVRE